MTQISGIGMNEGGSLTSGRTTNQQITGRLTCTVKEAASLLGVGRNTAYELVQQRKIPHVRLGKRIVVPRAALEQMLCVGPSMKEAA